jgi:hypothetical protein
LEPVCHHYEVQGPRAQAGIRQRGGVEQLLVIVVVVTNDDEKAGVGAAQAAAATAAAGGLAEVTAREMGERARVRPEEHGSAPKSSI